MNSNKYVIEYLDTGVSVEKFANIPSYMAPVRINKVEQYGVKLIPCQNTEGVIGYYNPETKVFKSVEQLFKEAGQIESVEMII